LKELSRIADTPASNCTHDAVFARAYLRMTQLYDATAPLMAEFAARFDPTMDDSNDPLGGGYWATFQLVSGWRENAWRNAEALVLAPTAADRSAVAANIEAEANATAQSLLLTQAYTPPLTSTAARDAFCAVHKGDAPPMAYDFGYASPWGYAY